MMTSASASRAPSPAPSAASTTSSEQFADAEEILPRVPLPAPASTPAPAPAPSAEPQARRDLREARLQLSQMATLFPCVGQAPRHTPTVPPLRPCSAACPPVPEPAVIDAAPANLGGTGTLAAFTEVPQYDRTHVPGCVCRPALAGGACCPGGVGSMTLQQMAGPTCAPHVGLQAGSLAASALGIAGVVSGLRVIGDSRTAQANLLAVAGHARRQEAEASIWRQQLGGKPALRVAHSHIAFQQESLRLLRRDLALAIAEQNFYRWVPGRLQVMASLGVLVSAAHHMLANPLGHVGAALLGAASSGLFGLYGLCMAGKNFAAWRRTRAAAPLSHSTGLPAAYRAAHLAHRDAAVAQACRTSAAWLGVAAAASLSCAVTLGFVAMPHAWVVTGAVSLVAGVAAMWSNSCSRYAPHLPVSPHMQRDAIVTTGQRGQLYLHLKAQQNLILAANGTFAAGLTRLQRLRLLWEQGMKPQCGAESFQVLAHAVAHRAAGTSLGAQALGAEPNLAQLENDHAETVSDDGSDTPPPSSSGSSSTSDIVDLAHVPHANALAAMPTAARDQAAQLLCVTAYLRHERALWHERHAAAYALQERRAAELAPLIDPGCSRMRAIAAEALAPGAATQRLYSQSARMLEEDARALAHAARGLAAIDALIVTCEALAPHVGALAVSDVDAVSAHQRKWLEVRLNVLQLSGLLRDAVTTSFVTSHGHMLKGRGAPHLWPLGNLYVMPDRFDALATALAAHMESGFVHAFFNPRRIEAEMDYLLEMELSAGPWARRTASAAQVAPAPIDACAWPATDAAGLAADTGDDFGASGATCCG